MACLSDFSEAELSEIDRKVKASVDYEMERHLRGMRLLNALPDCEPEFIPEFGNPAADSEVHPDPLDYTGIASVRPPYWGELPLATVVWPDGLQPLLAALRHTFTKHNIVHSPSPDNRTGMLGSAVYFPYGVIEFVVHIFAQGSAHTVSFAHMDGSRFGVSYFFKHVLFPELGFSYPGHLLRTPECGPPPVESVVRGMEGALDGAPTHTEGLTYFCAQYAATPEYFIPGGIGVSTALGIAELFLSSSPEYDATTRILCMSAISAMGKNPALCPSLRAPFERAVELGKQDANGHVKRFANSV